MKRILLLILCLFLPFGWVLWGQQPFASEKVFNGDFVDRDTMVETIISGKQLAAYHLYSFHSVKFPASPELAKEVADLVVADSAKASEKETVFVGGQLTYAVLVFHSDPGDTEYICFQSDGSMITLVYMMGTATLDDLKTIFATK